MISAAFDERGLGGSAPTAPVYVYNAINDEGSTISSVDAVVAAYCAGGTPVTYRREQVAVPISGHTGEYFLGTPGALAWLQQRAENPVAQTGCDIRTVPATILEPGALDTIPALLLVGPIRQVLGL